MSTQDDRVLSRCKYATREEALEAQRESRRRYIQSPAGKAKKSEASRRYGQSEGGKAKLKELKAKYRTQGSPCTVVDPATV